MECPIVKINKVEVIKAIFVWGMLLGFTLLGIGLGGVMGPILKAEAWVRIAVLGAFYVFGLSILMNLMDEDSPESKPVEESPGS